MAPQPSAIEPQFAPWAAQVFAVQPHRLVVPVPPQVCGDPQRPAVDGAAAAVGMCRSCPVAGHVVSFTHVPTATWAVAACTADGAFPMTVNVGDGVPVEGGRAAVAST